MHRKQWDDEAARRVALLDQYPKVHQKWFFWRSYGAPFSYARMIRFLIPSLTHNLLRNCNCCRVSNLLGMHRDRNYAALHWWRNLQSHCGPDTLPIIREDAFLLMLRVAVAGMYEQLVFMLF